MEDRNQDGRTGNRTQILPNASYHCATSLGTERGGAVVTGIREDLGSISGSAILISVFHGFPKSLQRRLGWVPNEGHGLFLPYPSPIPVQPSPSLMTSLSTRPHDNGRPAQVGSDTTQQRAELVSLPGRGRFVRAGEGGLRDQSGRCVRSGRGGEGRSVADSLSLAAIAAVSVGAVSVAGGNMWRLCSVLQLLLAAVSAQEDLSQFLDTDYERQSSELCNLYSLAAWDYNTDLANESKAAAVGVSDALINVSSTLDEPPTARPVVSKDYGGECDLPTRLLQTKPILVSPANGSAGFNPLDGLLLHVVEGPVHNHVAHIRSEYLTAKFLTPANENVKRDCGRDCSGFFRRFILWDVVDIVWSLSRKYCVSGDLKDRLVIVKKPSRNTEIVYGWKEHLKSKSSVTHKTPYDGVKRCRERKINIKASELANQTAVSTTATPHRRLYLYSKSARVRRQTEAIAPAAACLNLLTAVLHFEAVLLTESQCDGRTGELPCRGREPATLRLQVGHPTLELYESWYGTCHGKYNRPNYRTCDEIWQRQAIYAMTGVCTSRLTAAVADLAQGFTKSGTEIISNGSHAQDKRNAFSCTEMYVSLAQLTCPVLEVDCDWSRAGPPASNQQVRQLATWLCSGIGHGCGHAYSQQASLQSYQATPGSGIEPGTPWWEASSLTAQPPRPARRMRGLENTVAVGPGEIPWQVPCRGWLAVHWMRGVYTTSPIVLYTDANQALFHKTPQAISPSVNFSYCCFSFHREDKTLFPLPPQFLYLTLLTPPKMSKKAPGLRFTVANGMCPVIITTAFLGVLENEEHTVIVELVSPLELLSGTSTDYPDPTETSSRMDGSRKCSRE
ncbi:hypothetical protein PR048_010744 [Dryococelus australis]|uniref:Uncharacterized protein n=1 Tax=Dryococelus australis TaxID=614101 RepID=A0ABQ9I3J8_9NEOP|nr:hypothetical protein PR048_010744 [Dryococelus australis]